MKGIILAGGRGTRLSPITNVVSKQILPIYDKPMIYYPLSILMLAKIQDILIISTPRDLPMLQELLGDGSKLGIKLTYKEQPKPDGIAQAFLIGEEFIGTDPVCLILGDNIFHGAGLVEFIQDASKQSEGATVFACRVRDPERYGVVEFNSENRAISVEEKPKKPKSDWAVTGLYFYGGDVCQMVKGLKPSARGELEITDLNRLYLEQKRLSVECMGRGITWLDTGTPDSLLSAAQFVQTLSQRQSLRVACLEEIAFANGFIDHKQLSNLAEAYSEHCEYGNYVKQLVSQVE